MKIERCDESVLTLADFPLDVVAVLLTLMILPLAGLIHERAEGIRSTEHALAVSLCTLLGFLGASLFIKWSVFTFDRHQRNLTWHRRSLFGIKGGSVPFDTIRSVVVETITDSCSALQYRVTLMTESGGIPLTEYYTLGAAKRCERLRDQINHFLNAQPVSHPNQDIREMARAGHSIRAVARAKQQLGLSTSEAVRYVDEMNTPTPDHPAPK